MTRDDLINAAATAIVDLFEGSDIPETRDLAAAAVDAVLAETGWRDIASAPKDGTFIILQGGNSDEYSDCEYDGIDDPPGVVANWDKGAKEWRYCSYDSGYYGLWRDPKEWMPFPAPPVTS